MAKCDQCGMRIIDHGPEQGERGFCCGHYAKESGARELRDRA